MSLSPREEPKVSEMDLEEKRLVIECLSVGLCPTCEPAGKPGASYHNDRQNRSRGDNRRGDVLTFGICLGGRDSLDEAITNVAMIEIWKIIGVMIDLMTKMWYPPVVPLFNRVVLQSRPPHCSIDTTSGQVTFEVGRS